VSISALVRNYISFSGDQESDLIFATSELEDSPAQQQVVTLSIGANTITLPDVDGFTVHGLVIVPPATDAGLVTLKGVAGDTGILLSSTGASVIQFGETLPASIVLSAAAEVNGWRLIWF
jgi:hypothetical protein